MGCESWVAPKLLAAGRCRGGLEFDITSCGVDIGLPKLFGYFRGVVFNQSTTVSLSAWCGVPLMEIEVSMASRRCAPFMLTRVMLVLCRLQCTCV